jgi:diaminohydroxyphosphoribosylaminopyrimidine deaminase/5-amino-6-(5-phosphoribosylamino)uracil reductase
MAESDDEYWLRVAIEESRKCPPADGAFSVGAVVVRDGVELARGYSRETDPAVHAEEAALARLAGTDLAGATVYSSLEPCSARRSRPLTCTQLIIASRASRVVFAWREPAVFVDCHGAEELAAAGVEVVELPALAGAVREVNRHLLSAREP